MAANAQTATSPPLASVSDAAASPPSILLVSEGPSALHRAICKLFRRWLVAAAKKTGRTQNVVSTRVVTPAASRGTDVAEAAIKAASEHVSKGDRYVAVIVGFKLVKEGLPKRCFQPQIYAKRNAAARKLQSAAKAAGLTISSDKAETEALTNELASVVRTQQAASTTRSAGGKPAKAEAKPTPDERKHGDARSVTATSAGVAVTIAGSGKAGSAADGVAQRLQQMEAEMLVLRRLLSSQTAPAAAQPQAAPTTQAPIHSIARRDYTASASDNASASGASTASGFDRGSQSRTSASYANAVRGDQPRGQEQQQTQPTASVSSSGGSTGGIAGSGNSSNTVNVYVHAPQPEKAEKVADGRGGVTGGVQQHHRGGTGARRNGRGRRGRGKGKRGGKGKGKGGRVARTSSPSPASADTVPAKGAAGSAGPAAGNTKDGKEVRTTSSAPAPATGSGSKGAAGSAGGKATAASTSPAATGKTVTAADKSPVEWSAAPTTELANAHNELKAGKLKPAPQLLKAIQAANLKETAARETMAPMRKEMSEQGFQIMHVSGTGMKCQHNAVSAVLTGAEHLAGVLHAETNKTVELLLALVTLDQTKARRIPLMDDMCNTLDLAGTLTTEVLAKAGIEGYRLSSNQMAEAGQLHAASMLLGMEIAVWVVTETGSHNHRLDKYLECSMPFVKDDGTLGKPRGTIHLAFSGMHFSAAVSNTADASGMHGPVDGDHDLLTSIRGMTQEQFRRFIVANRTRALRYMTAVIQGDGEEADNKRVAMLQRRISLTKHKAPEISGAIAKKLARLREAIGAPNDGPTESVLDLGEDGEDGCGREEETTDSGSGHHLHAEATEDTSQQPTQPVAILTGSPQAGGETGQSPDSHARAAGGAAGSQQQLSQETGPPLTGSSMAASSSASSAEPPASIVMLPGSQLADASQPSTGPAAMSASTSSDVRPPPASGVKPGRGSASAPAASSRRGSKQDGASGAAASAAAASAGAAPASDSIAGRTRKNTAVGKPGSDAALTDDEASHHPAGGNPASKPPVASKPATEPTKGGGVKGK